MMLHVPFYLIKQLKDNHIFRVISQNVKTRLLCYVKDKYHTLYFISLRIGGEKPG